MTAYKTKKFLTSFLTWILLASVFSVYAADDEEEEKTYSRFRFKIPAKTITREGVAPSKDAEDHGHREFTEAEWKQKRQDAVDFWKEHKKSGKPIDKTTLVKLYEAAGNFKIVHTLLTKEISADESRQLGALRQSLHEEVLGNTLRNSKGERLGVNDFGSGADPNKVDAKTDIDFTQYSDDQSVTGEHLVARYKEEFRKVSHKYGAALDPGQLDIVAHKFEATIPDWRQNDVRGDFEVRLRTGLDLLKSNPEAYFLEGAYLQQVMRRSADPFSKTFTWFSTNEKGDIVKKTLNSTKASPFFYHPDIAARYSWGASVGNWHFFNAHKEDLAAMAKYLLRSTDDGAGLTLGKLKKGEYEKLNTWQRRLVLNQIYGGRLSADKIKGIQAVLDTASNIRALKDQQKLSVSTIEGRLEAYAPMIERERQLAGDIEYSNEDLLRMAEHGFERIGQMMLLENNVLTSKNRVKDWLSPSLEVGKELHYLDKNNNKQKIVIDQDTIKRLQYSAFFELRDGMSLMSKAQIEKIKRENPRARRDIEILEGIIEKQRQLLQNPETMTTKEVQDWRQKSLDALSDDYKLLKEYTRRYGYGKGFLTAALHTIARADQVETWMHNRIQDAVVSKVSGQKYLPALERLRSQVNQTNQNVLGTDWMIRFDVATSFIEVAKAYIREGEMNEAVYKVALREGLSYLPFVGSYYSLQSGISGASTIVLVRVIPGYGQILLVGHFVKGAVELGGLMVFEPLKRDKVLLAYQGYLPPEEGGWFFFTGQKERVESPRPSLLYPVDPNGQLPLEERREKMYEFFNNRITAIMNNDSSVWYTEDELPFEWEKKEFQLLRPHVEAYVDDWWNAEGLFSEFDVLTVHSGPDIRSELVKKLIEDYVKGKNISKQKEMQEMELSHLRTHGLMTQVASESVAFDEESKALRENYDLAGELMHAIIVDELPEIEPSIEIIAVPRVDTLEEGEKKHTLTESIALRAKIHASMEKHPGPWQLKWKVTPTGGEEQAFSSIGTEEGEATVGTVTVTVEAYDAEDKLITSASVQFEVERFELVQDEDEDDDKDDQDDEGQTTDDGDKEEEETLVGDMDGLVGSVGDLVEDGLVNCNEGNDKCQSAGDKLEDYKAFLEDIEDRLQYLETSPHLKTALIEITNLLQKSKQLGEEIIDLRGRAEKLALAVCERLDEINKADDFQIEAKKLRESQALMKQLEEVSQQVEKKWTILRSIFTLVNDKIARWKELVERYQEVEKDLSEVTRYESEVRQELDLADQLVQKGDQFIDQVYDIEKTAQSLIAQAAEASPETLTDLSAGNLVIYSKIEQLEACMDGLYECVEGVRQNLEEILSKSDELGSRLLAVHDALYEKGANYPEEVRKEAEALLDTGEIFADAAQERLKDGRLCHNLSTDFVETHQPVVVPDVEYMTLKNAKETLNNLNLKIAVIAGVPAPEKGLSYTVEQQEPKPNSKVNIGTVVRLKIYGPYKEKVWVVPTVLGMKAREARQRLNSEGFDAEIQTGKSAPSKKDEYRAYSQVPSPNAKVTGDKGTVVVKMYGKYQPPQTPTRPVEPIETPVVETTPQTPFYVACKLFIPKLPEKPPEGQKYKDYVRKLTPENTTFSYDGTNIFLMIRGDALKSYPKEYFRTGRRISMTINIEGFDKDLQKNITLHGAFLLEVAGTYETQAELIRAYPDEKKSLANKSAGTDNKSLTFLVFKNEDGTFFGQETKKGEVIKIYGQGFVDGWPRSMKEKSLQFIRLIIELFDCFVATAVYGPYDLDQLNVLREFRDKVMLVSDAGKRLVNHYYRLGPSWAQWVKQHPLAGEVIKPLFNFVVNLTKGKNLDDPQVTLWFDRVFKVIEWVGGSWLDDQQADPPVSPLQMLSGSKAE